MSVALGGLGGAENWPLPAGYLQTFGRGWKDARHFPRVHPWQQVMEPAKGLGTPRESDFGGQWGWIAELPQDWGSRETDSWRAQKGPCAHQGPGEGAASPQETDPDLL